MNSAGKTAIAALCINLAVYSPALAQAALTGAQPDSDRLQTLLKTIDEQNQKLEKQQADIDRQRSDLEKQKAELLKLKAAIARSTALSSPANAKALAQNGHSAASRQLSGSGAPATTAQALGYDGRSQLVGSTAKNDLAIPAPGREDVASNASPYDSDGNIRVHTLKDLVHAAIAPALSGESEVGEKPKKETPAIDIAVLADRGGVLTPRGTLVITPAVEYSHSSVERFFFDGVELVEAVQIGNLLAESINRESITRSFGFRYGLTRRLEIDASVPFLYRDDKTVDKDLSISGFPNSLVALRGDGIGDVEFGAHYQLNRPKGPYPYFVAGIRAKSPTGNGPFDVGYDLSKGLPKTEPTGSGFWTVEPQFTMIYPSDPVVLFANVGWQYTFSQDVNKVILDNFAAVAANPTFNLKETRTTVGQVEPGGTLDIGMGLGIGLNDSVSVSLGYQHSWVLGTTTHTKTEVFLEDSTGQNSPALSAPDSFTSVVNSQDAQIGQLLIGASVAVDDHVGLNFNVAIGVTDDAPDVTVTFRTPLSWRVFQ